MRALCPNFHVAKRRNMAPSRPSGRGSGLRKLAARGKQNMRGFKIENRPACPRGNGQQAGHWQGSMFGGGGEPAKKGFARNLCAAEHPYCGVLVTFSIKLSAFSVKSRI